VRPLCLAGVAMEQLAADLHQAGEPACRLASRRALNVRYKFIVWQRRPADPFLRSEGAEDLNHL
jgi:hypothetical protein